MKCPECGYVSFDELEECKKCGARLRVDEGSGETGEKSRRQEELFSLRIDDEPEDPEQGTEEPPYQAFVLPEEEGTEGPLVLPDMNVDFDPSTVVEAERQEAVEEQQEESLPATEGETLLPEEIWIEEGAGFLRRLAAFAIDSAILAAILSLFLIGAMAALGRTGGAWTAIGTPEGVSALFVPFYLLGLFVSLCYFTFFVGWVGQTPGKALLKMEVHRTDGGPMSYSRAFLRWVGYLVSVTFAGMGFLWIFFDERKRGWHDYLSGTWVKDLRHNY